MSTKVRGGRDNLTHCPNCGEDYASTYRRCPFCNAKPARGGQEEDDLEPFPLVDADRSAKVDYEEPYEEELPAPSASKGGKRLATTAAPLRGGSGKSSRAPSTSGRGGRVNTSGGGYGRKPSPVKVLVYLVSLAVIIAALWLVLFKLGPKIAGVFSGPSTQTESPAPSPSPSATVMPSPSPTPVIPTVPPVSEPPEDVTTQPINTPTPGGALQLSRTDFTLSDKYPTYTVKATGANGTVTWAIEDSSVATITQTGLVTAMKNGYTRLTATDELGITARCEVRVAGFTGGQTDEPSPSATPAAPSAFPSAATGASLSANDVTFSERNGYTATLRVNGGTAASWASDNEAVATVTQSGVVSGLKEGTANITCTLDSGETLTCVVRVR